MAKIKALLVGVTKYDNPLKERDANGNSTLKDKSMPSAAADVERVFDLIAGLTGTQPGSRFSQKEVRVTVSSCTGLKPGVTSDKDTSISMDTSLGSVAEDRGILGDLAWLFKDATAGDQLLFYFSGHGFRVHFKKEDSSGSSGESALDSIQAAIHGGTAVPGGAVDVPASTAQASEPEGPPVFEVLCTGDTDWKTKGFLTDTMMMELACDALKAGACLEVVLEACSQGGFQETTDVYPFACFFAGNNFPAGRGAIWAASVIDQRSQSGPVPPCEKGPVVGLFTKYFCDRLPGAASRQALLTDVAGDLKAYKLKRIACPCPDDMADQTPSLFCTASALLEKPMAATCGTLLDVPAYVPPGDSGEAASVTHEAIGSGQSGYTSRKFVRPPEPCGPPKPPL